MADVSNNSFMEPSINNLIIVIYILLNLQVRRNSIIKHLCRQINQERTINRHPEKLMNNQLGEFSMAFFDEFVEAYKATNTLAPEALAAFDHFIQALMISWTYLETSQKK